MNDRRAHFLTTVGDTCLAAALAELSVELVLQDGTRRVGVPAPCPSRPGSPPVAESGYSNELCIGDVAVALGEVAVLTIRTP